MKTMLMIPALMFGLSVSAQYHYENDFSVQDESRRPYGIDVERTTQYSHGHGRIENGEYVLLLYHAKHFLETPKLRDFRLVTDFRLEVYRQEFELGVKTFFRWDRDADRGGELKFYWTKQALFVIELNGEIVFSRQDSALPKIDGRLVLEVKGDRAEGDFLGERFAFRIPDGLPERGYVAFDHCFSPGTQAMIRRLELDSADECPKTKVRDWKLALSTEQGFQEPIRYDIAQYRYESGETEFAVSLSGTVQDRGPRLKTGGSHWCSIHERLTDPYVRFESGEELRNCLLYNGMKMFKDLETCRELGDRCPASRLPPLEWPIRRSYLFRTFPEKFTLAAGYGYAMAHPWRFAANGPYEAICDQDGKLLYQGGSLRKGLAAIRILPVADAKIVDRVPTGVPNREKAVKHAATCGYFSETTSPAFTIAVCCREADFSEGELKLSPRIEDVYGEAVARLEGGKTEKLGVRRLPGGIRETRFALRSERPLPVGVYRVACDWNAGGRAEKEIFIFEVLPDTPDGPCPPLASGLPAFYSIPDEIKYLESSPLDPWADFAGIGHYYSIDERYPLVGLTQNIDRFYPLYRRRWWSANVPRDCDGHFLYGGDRFEELIKRVGIIQPFGIPPNEQSRWELGLNSYYRNEQLRLLRDFVVERKPALKLLTLEGIDACLATKKCISVDEMKDLFYTCWEEWLAYARPKISQRVTEWLDRIYSLNPKVGIAGGGPYSIYVATYKSAYVLKYNGYPVENDERLRRNGGFYQFEDYHMSCDYPISRPAFFVASYEMMYPNGRAIYPEIYYRGWGTRCNDGAVFHAHPTSDDGVYEDTHQRRIVYAYTYGTPFLRDGEWGYWRRRGFHARNPERESMDEFIHAWGKLVKNEPARPLKAPYVVLDAAELSRHGEYLEDEHNYRVRGRGYDYTMTDIDNTAEEALAYTYEQAIAAGYNNPVLTTYADLDRLDATNCDFAVLPPVVKGTPAEVLAKIRALHDRGVPLVTFECAEGLEDLFGIVPAAERRVGAFEGEVFSHKLAAVRHAAAKGAEVAAWGAAKTGAKADIPLVVLNATAKGRTAFVTLPPTVVKRSTFSENYSWGQPSISRAMVRAERAMFRFLEPAPDCSAERGSMTAVLTERGDYAVTVSEATLLYGSTERYPASYRFTVTAPGIGGREIEADAPVTVVERTADRVTVRSEIGPDTANFFRFVKR